jgi:hypothetical protein
VILAVGAGVAAVFRADGFPWPNCIGFGLVACAALALAANRFYLPSTYTIDDAGLTARSFAGTKIILWKNARRFLHDDRGGFLSSRARRSWLDSMHGVHILFDADPRRAREAIESRIAAACSAPSLPFSPRERGGGEGFPPERGASTIAPSESTEASRP